MNKILFGGKQFFLGTVYVTREWLTPFGLTPARYDMLTAVASDRRGVAQSALREILGVTAPTICRMLKSLEELGLVVRTPHPRNRRHRWVAITAAGLHALTSAIATIVDNDLGWMTKEILSTEPGFAEHDARCMREADEMFTRANHALGPFATLRYPYERYDENRAA
jgi:DNA-binding MarR family transcriptional regulator